jgi:hypothetical protein
MKTIQLAEITYHDYTFATYAKVDEENNVACIWATSQTPERKIVFKQDKMWNVVTGSILGGGLAKHLDLTASLCKLTAIKLHQLNK